MNWNGPIMTDSGGFQVMSLISRSELGVAGNLKQSNLRQTMQKIKGEITEHGAKFQLGGVVRELTPESSIEIQLDLDSDILVVLDDPAGSLADRKRTKESLERTTRWAERSKKAFLKAGADKKGKKLFAVVQGGIFKDLRIESARQLSSIGFDGYGLGGWTFDPASG